VKLEDLTICLIGCFQKRIVGASLLEWTNARPDRAPLEKWLFLRRLTVRYRKNSAGGPRISKQSGSVVLTTTWLDGSTCSANTYINAITLNPGF